MHILYMICSTFTAFVHVYFNIFKKLVNRSSSQLLIFVIYDKMKPYDVLTRGESMHSILRWVKGFLKKNTEDHLGAYASQAAFFIFR